MELNVDTNTYVTKTLLWNVRPWKHPDGSMQARIFPDNAYAIQWDSALNKWLIDAGRWGGIAIGEAHMGVHSWQLDNFPLGPVVLSNGIEQPFPLVRQPGTKPENDCYNYDIARIFANGVYNTAYAYAKNDTGGRGVIRVTSSSPFGPYAVPVAAQTPEDLVVKEGINVVNINGNINYLATNGGADTIVYNESLAIVGSNKRTDTGQSVNPTHECIFILGGSGSVGRVFWMAYDGTLYLNRGFTAGDGRLLEATSTIPVYNGVMLGLPF